MALQQKIKWTTKLQPICDNLIHNTYQQIDSPRKGNLRDKDVKFWNEFVSGLKNAYVAGVPKIVEELHAKDIPVLACIPGMDYLDLAGNCGHFHIHSLKDGKVNLHHSSKDIDQVVKRFYLNPKRYIYPFVDGELKDSFAHTSVGGESTWIEVSLPEEINLFQPIIEQCNSHGIVTHIIVSRNNYHLNALTPPYFRKTFEEEGELLLTTYHRIDTAHTLQIVLDQVPTTDTYGIVTYFQNRTKPSTLPLVEPTLGNAKFVPYW